MTAHPEPTAHEPEPRLKTAWDQRGIVLFLSLFSFPGYPRGRCGAVGPFVVSPLLSRVSFFSPFVMSFVVEFLRETISRQFVSHDVADKDFVERTKRLQAKGKEMYVLCCFFAGD